MTSVDLNVYASIPTRNMIEYSVKYDSWSSSTKKKARTTAQDHTPTEHKKTWPGTRIGHLTVVDATDQRKSEYIVWRCRCDCGNEILLDTRALRRQTITDCGCITKVKPGQKDMTGQRFGKLVCLYPEQGKSKNGSSVWRCRCDCGNICTVGQTKLQSGLTVSCGCYNAEKRRESQKNVDGTRISLLESLLSGKLRETNTSGHTGVSFIKIQENGVQALLFRERTITLVNIRQRKTPSWCVNRQRICSGIFCLDMEKKCRSGMPEPYFSARIDGFVDSLGGMIGADHENIGRTPQNLRYS